MRKGRNAAREETSSLNLLPIPEIVTSILPFRAAHYRSAIPLVPPNGRASKRNLAPMRRARALQNREASPLSNRRCSRAGITLTTRSNFRRVSAEFLVNGAAPDLLGAAIYCPAMRNRVRLRAIIPR
jgi:hypothetical protein